MTQQFFSNLRLKKVIFFLFLFSLISLIQLYLIIKIVDKGDQVSIRDLIFTTFVSDLNTNKIKNILSEIEYSKFDENQKQYYLKQIDKRLQNIILSLQNELNIDKKVELLLNQFSPSFNLENVECNSTTNLVYNVNTIFTKGLGCCSDYAKVSIFLLNLLGIDAREVNNYRHTTIEYFNKQKRKWIWMDPSYRIFAYKGKNIDNKLDQFEVFTNKLNDSTFYQFASKQLLNFIPLKQIHYYRPQQYSSISYSLMNTNNNIRDKLIDFGIHKSLVDLFYLVTGINKGKLTVIPNGNSYIFYVFAQICAYITILLIITLNIFISLKINFKD